MQRCSDPRHIAEAKKHDALCVLFKAKEPQTCVKCKGINIRKNVQNRIPNLNLQSLRGSIYKVMKMLWCLFLIAVYCSVVHL